MTDFKTDMNIQQTNYEPNTLIDEVSETEIYLGISNNSSNVSGTTWQIKKRWKVGTVWFAGYPDGKQTFEFTWGNKNSYTYK